MHSLETIWERHNSYVRRFLVRLAGDVDLADDLLQETYLRARAGLSAYRGGDAKAWLAAIARNVFYAHARRKASRQHLLGECEVPEELGAGGFDEDLLLRLALDREIERLAPNLRRALVMKYYGEHTYQEIASKLGCAIGTAKWRVSTAVARLQQAFGLERREVISVVEKSLKEDVLHQLALQPLRFSVREGSCDEELKAALRIEVTEVFGSSPTITDGSNYLVCGNYKLARPVVDCVVLAARGKTTGYHAFLSPGQGAFELYGHVVQRLPPPSSEEVLIIMAFPRGVECAVEFIILEGWP